VRDEVRAYIKTIEDLVQELKAGNYEPVDFRPRRKAVPHAVANGNAVTSKARRSKMAVEYDPALINKVFEVTEPVEVKAEKIQRYCAALDETNPIYTDDEAAKKGPYGGIVAPPSFAVTFRNGRHFLRMCRASDGAASTRARTSSSSRRSGRATR